MGDETVRVVVFEEGDRFVAQCLEYDICVEGRTIPSLLGRLELTIEAELATCAAAGKDIRAAIGAAPNAYADLWTRRTVQLKRIGPGTSLPLFRLDIGMIENARAAAQRVAVSFGGHPTLQAFVDEAQGLGCVSMVEARQTREGRAYNALIVSGPGGAKLTIVDPEFTERLSPSVVSSYERRLGIKTRFAGLPEQPSKNATFENDDEEGSE